MNSFFSRHKREPTLVTFLCNRAWPGTDLGYRPMVRPFLKWNSFCQLKRGFNRRNQFEKLTQISLFLFRICQLIILKEKIRNRLRTRRMLKPFFIQKFREIFKIFRINFANQDNNCKQISHRNQRMRKNSQQ